MTFLAFGPIAAMFFALLVALVKHGDGVRGPTQAASMIETEVTSWDKDPCEEFGAEYSSYFKACRCPEDRPTPTKECGDRDLGCVFGLSGASKGCRCVTKAAYEELLKIPVSASALRFCDALAEQSARARKGSMGGNINRALEKTSPAICQHALTGTISKTEAEEAPFAEEASELSRKGKDEDGNGDRAYGRMRSAKESATTPAETALWEHALSQVCKDECDDLLKMMRKEARNLEADVLHHHTPFAQTCAERVVQHVEADVLGCCGRSCGYDGRRCLLWPFFSLEEKVNWEVECCGEMNVLKNSSRELMCNSVLSDRLAKEASQYDLEEEDGTDVGKVLIGQNSSLLWTKKGAQESALGKEAQAHGGEKVNMDFLLKHPKIGEEYLHLGYFREEPLSKILNKATSLMEVSSQDGTCDFGEFKKQCPKHFVTNYMKTCQDSWMVAEEREEQDFREQVLENCWLNDPQYVAAPEDCDKLANESSILVYFTHDHNNEKKPIACVTLGKQQCVTAEEKQWWKEIQLKSVQEVMNAQEIKDYTDRVYYVRVKADSK